MKRFFTLILIISICQILIAGINDEFRTTWVVTWELTNSTNSMEENKALTRQILDNHKQANMNAVLWQCRQNGTAYYNSSYEPWGEYIGYKNPGYDPLEYAVQEAHNRGLELHAWMNVFESRNVSINGTPAKEHPEWICRDQNGNPMTNEITLSPGLSAVRAYLINVALEIVRNYDIDGLHFDYVRWNPYPEAGLNFDLLNNPNQPSASEPIMPKTANSENTTAPYRYDIEHPFSAGVPAGFNTWEDWCRWSVTEFVRVLHDSIQAVKPWVRLSVSALGNYNWGGETAWNGYYRVYQDAALWFNEGYIDQLMPMHYHWFTGQEFYGMLQGNCPKCWSQFIQPGIQAGRLYTVGPYSTKMNEDRLWNRHPQIVESSRKVFWVDGFQFFSYGSWKEQNYWETAKSLFFNRKTKIRATKLIVDATPSAPAIALSRIDSLTYQISVTPPNSMQENQWLAIYRSEDSNLELYRDAIVDIHFGNSEYSYIDYFSGIQDYDDRYYYFATMLDRYWNESNPSNAEQSDQIFSFAPTVINTTPAEGDTVAINSIVSITFSKTMDTNSFANAISFVPEKNISQLNWSDDHKMLTILTSSKLEYATDYIFTIAPSITDINGKALDGNGDGTSGDAFVLNFRTKEVDDVGPQILSSYPDLKSYFENFAIDEVITFLFDEAIEANTVNDTSILVKHGEDKIDIGYHLTMVNEKSVLSIQPLKPLESDTEYLVSLMSEISDTIGNPRSSDISVQFKTMPETYAEEIMIDKFFSSGNWYQPDESGSTVGIIKPNTIFQMSGKAYLPASPIRQRSSANLQYEWDESSTEFLIREYLVGEEPRKILFDTTFVLQCFVFGDGSHNQFRFCIQEGNGTQWADYEVSEWISFDWYGWRLLEWKLNDPNRVDQWIGFDGRLLGNGLLDASTYRFDSFQLTHESSAAISGTIYFDNLRLVKKVPKTIDVRGDKPQIATAFKLYQNYPNPFNPTTKIPFDIIKSSQIVVKVYDILGRDVATPVNQKLMPGHYEIEFDGSHLASGAYFYRLEIDGQIFIKRMLLLK